MTGLRRLLGHRWLLPLTALLLRARTVRPSAAFALRELARLRGAYRYRLAGGGPQVVLRHGTPDIVTLGEVFHDRDYLPDADVEHMLSGARTIVDLGANIGLFGAFAVARWPEAEIVAFEPDPANLEVHRQTVAVNGLQGRWKLIGAAAGRRDADVAFIGGEVSLSRVAAAGEDGTMTVAVQDVLPLIGEADLLKMDIEGGEWAIIGDPRFRSRPPRVVVMEYHPYRCPTDDARAAATAALRDAGMTVQPITHHETGHGMLWAWRT
jgi:FkbM family methyltransferase